MSGKSLDENPRQSRTSSKLENNNDNESQSSSADSIANDNNKQQHHNHEISNHRQTDPDEEEDDDSEILRGLVSLLYGGEPSSLGNWSQKTKNGVIRRVLDADINAFALELIGSNVSTTYINMPPGLNQNMNLEKPVLVMIVKNMKKFFAFEIMVLDNFNIRRKFRASTYQTITRLKQFLCLMPLRLEKGWNQVVFNLPDFVKRAYGTEYVCTLRLQIHANCRLRRIYFCDRPYAEEELPTKFQLYKRNVDSAANNGEKSAPASSTYARATSHDSAGSAAKPQRKRTSPTEV